MLRPLKIIFEYLKREKDIAADRSEISRLIFDLIAGQCGLSGIQRYDRANIANICGMPLIASCSMTYSEKLRTGRNSYFPNENNGWIEVCLLAAG